MRPSPYIYPGIKMGVLTPKQIHALRGKERDVTALLIIFSEVCNYFGVLPEAAKKKSRIRSLVWVRQMYCYLSRKFTSLNLYEIGNVIGGRDHTTVIHSADTATNLIEKYPDLAEDARILETRICEKLYNENQTIKDFVK